VCVCVGGWVGGWVGEWVGGWVGGWGVVGWGGVGWGGVGWGGVGWGGVGWGGYTEFILFYKAHYYIYTEYCSLANYCVTFCLCLD
jgi:hypothetical protein